MPATPTSTGSPLAAAGALCAALAVALAAYAAHAANGTGQGLLQIAAVLLFGHGVALAALARGAQARRRRVALVALLAGSLLFAGSLAMHALAGVQLHLAPTGGLLMIGGWVLLAIDLFRE
jgi:uncharacterized membrane protein YgdD (TMEM256/DUF423 family)